MIQHSTEGSFQSVAFSQPRRIILLLKFIIYKNRGDTLDIFCLVKEKKDSIFLVQWEASSWRLRGTLKDNMTNLNSLGIGEDSLRHMFQSFYFFF